MGKFRTTVPYSDLNRFIRNRYSMVAENNDERFANMFMDLLGACTDTRKNLKTILDEVMISLHRYLGFRQIAIALRDTNSLKYKY